VKAVQVRHPRRRKRTVKIAKAILPGYFSVVRRGGDRRLARPLWRRALSSPQQLGALIDGPFKMPPLQKARVNPAAASRIETPILSEWGHLAGATGDPTCEIGVCGRGSLLSTKDIGLNQPLG
jgi:hypothetical protein